MEITMHRMKKIMEIAQNYNCNTNIQTDVTAMSKNHMLEVISQNSLIEFNSAITQNEIDAMREILDEAEKAIVKHYAIHDGDGHYLYSIGLSDCGQIVFDVTKNVKHAFKTQNLETAKQLTKFFDGQMEVIR